MRPAGARERSIGVVLRHPVAVPVLMLALLLVPGAARASAPNLLVLDEHGHVRAQHDRFLPSAEPAAPGTTERPGATARASVRTSTTVPGRLRALERDGELSAEQARAHLDAYTGARRTLKGLRGRARAELSAVLRNAEALASDGLLSASRVKAALATVRRNAQWWGAGSPLAYGRRIRFAGSRLIWQSYPGQGVQIQWLGTFGRMNQLFLARGYDTELAAMAREIESYAAERAGGKAWEYQFAFSGGRPPWVSGLSQGTAISALSRAAVRLRDPRWFSVARSALGVFRAPPPSGVRLRAREGAHYLAYSQAPGLRIYNAFLQSVIGLHDFAVLANDRLGRRLYLEGVRRARVEIRWADTGSWSLYRPGVPSSIDYHKVLRDFARGLCSRMSMDRQRAVLALRARVGDPAAVLRAFDRYPDGSPFCIAQQHFNRYLYARLKALGLPGPWG